MRSNSDPSVSATNNALSADSTGSSQPSAQSAFSFPQRSATMPSQPLTPLTAPMDDEYTIPSNTYTQPKPANDLLSTQPRLTTDSGPRTPSVYQGPYPQPGALFPPTTPHHASSTSLSRSKTQIERKPVPAAANGEQEEKKIFGLFRRKSSRQLSKKSISAPGVKAPEPVPSMPEIQTNTFATPATSSERLARFDSESQLLPNNPAPPRPARPGRVDQMLEHLQLTKTGGLPQTQSPSPEKLMTPPGIPVLRDDDGQELSISDHDTAQSWPKRSSDASIYSLAASTPPARAPVAPIGMTAISENTLIVPKPARSPLGMHSETTSPNLDDEPPSPVQPQSQPHSQAQIQPDHSPRDDPEPSPKRSPDINEDDFEDEEDFVAELPLKIPVRTSSKKNKLRPARFSVEPDLPSKKDDELGAKSNVKGAEAEVDDEPVGDLPSSIPQPGTYKHNHTGHRHSPTESTTSSNDSHLGFDDRTNSTVSSAPTSNASSFAQWKHAADSEPLPSTVPTTDPSHHVVSSSTSSAGRAANFSRPRAPTGTSTTSTASNSITISPVKANEVKVVSPQVNTRNDASIHQSVRPLAPQLVDSPPPPTNQSDSPSTISPADLTTSESHKHHQAHTNTSLPPTPEDANISHFPSPASTSSPDLSNDTRFPPGLNRRPTNPRTKGPCRGCGLEITGKSVKAADGRLTGRYHRACFTCTTCRTPFASASFYVLHDEPFCRAHYHALNGSVCSCCRSGIEGSYFEILGRRKFHTDCFSCFECRVGLKGDYFELGGRFYCERDAARAHARMMSRHHDGRGGGLGAGLNGPRFPERRTTRLMFT